MTRIIRAIYSLPKSNGCHVDHTRGTRMDDREMPGRHTA